jgi:hypothetical protein
MEGFALFLDRGAYFADCNYDYANTRTAPGHATLFTGSYTSGHGIVSNEWWDPQKKKRVTSVEDDATKTGRDRQADSPGASPHNLLSDTLGDELKLATGGKARVFANFAQGPRGCFARRFFRRRSVLDRSQERGMDYVDFLPGRFAGMGAQVQRVIARRNSGTASGKTRMARCWDRRLRAMAMTESRPDFMKSSDRLHLPTNISLSLPKNLCSMKNLEPALRPICWRSALSANDILGHQVGPDSPQMKSMALELDRQLAEFFGFLGHQVGMANVWMALSADHGVAPLPEVAKALRLPASHLDSKALREQVNALLSKKYTKKADYLLDLDYSLAWLNDEAFTAAGGSESSAEIDAGEALKQVGFAGYFTKYRLGQGTSIPDTELGRRYAHSYSPEGGWYVMGIPNEFQVGGTKGTDHATPFSYDTHVPLAFYGLAFQPGVYRTHAEPVDLAVTLASLLGINAPAQATGRVLTEALAPPHRAVPPPVAGGSQ